MRYLDARNFARELRMNQTKAEDCLWRRVRNRRFFGYKFTRQFLIEYSKGSYFIADFYCHEAQLIVEVDGKIHLQQKEYDESRTRILNDLGYKVIRLKNEDVIDDWEGTDKVILEAIKGTHP
ncbi:MAG: endonuclease domain-containing protein [Cytophagia bacterium]|nr:endonuclease domain-containing protein [Cytophagia bacterium]